MLIKKIIIMINDLKGLNVSLRWRLSQVEVKIANYWGRVTAGSLSAFGGKWRWGR